MKRQIFIAAAVLFSKALHAQQDTTEKILNEVVVTANKVPQKQSETGKVVTIITQDQLKKSFGESLGEVLNQQAGLIINGADNNLGTNQTVYLRGAASANTLIMVDGIPLYDASGVTSEFDLNNFALDDIERIEIVKGTQSTLYGSDAVAGVINIITKKGDKKPFNLHLDLSAGSYSTYQGNISVSGNNGKGQTYFLSYNKITGKGFSSAYDSTGKAGFDKDGFDQDVLQLNYAFKPSERTSVRLFGKYNYNHSDLDEGAFTDDKDFAEHNDNTIAGVSSDYKMKHGFIRLQYYFNQFNRNFLDDSILPSDYGNYQKGRYNGTSNFAEIYTNLHFNDHVEFLAGADFRTNKTDQAYIYYPDYGYPALPVSGDSAKTNQLSGYASLFLKSKNFNLDFGGRWNHHSIYGNNFTYSINPFLLINDHYKVYVNIASGYNVPSLYQLYSEYGNRKLKPEITTGYEAGVQYFTNTINARVTGFIRNGKDVILFYTDPLTYNSYYINGDKQHDYGVETEATIHFAGKFAIAFNYTYVDGKVTSGLSGSKDTSYFNLYKRPKNVMNLSLNYTVNKNLYLSAHLKTVSKAFEPAYMAPPFQLNGYYVLDAYARYTFSKKIGIFSSFQNITGQKYFVTRGYTTKGFNVNAGLQLSL
ncbi:MAG TPA: TonB-dependent receptor [Candidatus Babeliaceae bacterium]|nr:TonB-dependent receptor [Candidatus Babeliaceae bacterium]